MSITFFYPIVGRSTDYVSLYNANIDLTDIHDHVQSGQTLTQKSVDWGIVDLDEAYIYDIDWLQLGSQIVTQPFSLSTAGGTDLYYRDSDLYIRITANGFVDLIDAVNGFYGDMSDYDASCVFTNDNNTYSFLSEGVTSLQCASITTPSLENVTQLTISQNLSNDSQESLLRETGFETTNQQYFVQSFAIGSDGKMSNVRFLRDGHFAGNLPPESAENCFLQITASGYPNTAIKNFYDFSPKGGYIRCDTDSIEKVDNRPWSDSNEIIWTTGATSMQDQAYIDQDIILCGDIVKIVYPEFYNSPTPLLRTQRKPACIKCLVQLSADIPSTGGFSGENLLYAQIGIGSQDSPQVYILGYNYSVVLDPTEFQQTLQPSDIGLSVISESMIQLEYTSGITICLKHNNKLGLALTFENLYVLIQYWAI